MGAPGSNPDVCVIGGGVIGLAVAYRLAAAGLRVALVERGRCGRAASWAGAGIIDYGSHARSDPLAMLRRASCARYPAFAAELHECTGIDPQYRACGALDLITDDNQQAAAQREVSAAAGHPLADGTAAVELLTPEQARALEPRLTPQIRGALLKRRSAQVRSPRMLAALRAACAALGVELREQTAVQEPILEGERVRGVRTAAGPLEARWTVLAAGAWSPQLAPALATLMPGAPVRGQIVLLKTAPLARMIEHGRNYLVSRDDGHVLCGSTQEPEAGFAAANTAGGVASILNTSLRFMPSLGQAELVQVWAGLRPGAPDGKPYLGPVPAHAGLIAATAHLRGGWTLAPITADLVAEYITTGRTRFDWTPFLPGRSFTSFDD
jgi:glycine oxidase